MTKIVASSAQIAVVTGQYWILLAQYVFLKLPYSQSTFFPDDMHARVHIFQLSLIFKLWYEKHYRNSSLQQDMKDNLRNVAVPGTGVPLSIFCYHYLLALWFVFLMNPLICFIGAINQVYRQQLSANHDNILFHFIMNIEEYVEALEKQYQHNLLYPDDWFSLWRTNCNLVAYHAHITNSQDYKMEDKWTFLTQGKDMGVPISPFIDNIDGIVCKHKLIEGGMGIHVYQNAAFGGDWILQEKLHNAQWLQNLLPNHAPLSTMRIITMSTYTLSKDYPINKSKSLVNSSSLLSQQLDQLEEADMENYNNLRQNSNTSNQSEHTISTDSNSQENSFQVDENATKYVTAECCVLRLGRKDAKTDHNCILFDINKSDGVIKNGCLNHHWYQLGLDKVLTTNWLPVSGEMTTHLDVPNGVVTGKVVPDMKEALDIVISSHYKMLPEVPIVGWDVAFTTKGIFLLEVNLSCNFFKGSFDMKHYITFLHKHFLSLEKMESLNIDWNSSSNDSTSLNKLENNSEKNHEKENEMNNNGSGKKYKRNSFKKTE